MPTLYGEPDMIWSKKQNAQKSLKKETRLKKTSNRENILWNVTLKYAELDKIASILTTSLENYPKKLPNGVRQGPLRRDGSGGPVLGKSKI